MVSKLVLSSSFIHREELLREGVNIQWNRLSIGNESRLAYLQGFGQCQILWQSTRYLIFQFPFALFSSLSSSSLPLAQQKP